MLFDTNFNQGEGTTRNSKNRQPNGALFEA